jgi:hypothetical protein
LSVCLHVASSSLLGFDWGLTESLSWPRILIKEEKSDFFDIFINLEISKKKQLKRQEVKFVLFYYKLISVKN